MTSDSEETEHNTEPASIHVPIIASGVIILLFIALVVFVVLHFTEGEKLLGLLKQTDPLWILAGVLFELSTYIAGAGVWYSVAKEAGYNLKFGFLAKLSVEELSLNHLIPAGGVAGHTLIVQAIRRKKLPTWLGMEMVLVDLLGFYTAYSLATALAVLALWLHHGVTPVLKGVVSIFFLIIVAMTSLILMFLFHKIKLIPKWIRKIKIVSILVESIKNVSKERVLSPNLLLKASVLRASIFLLDSMTLWAMMHALSVPITFTTTFVALVIGSIASSVAFWPGGFVGFDAACVTVLILFKVPAEAAIAGTLLLRGLSLWLPLLPGLWLARKEISFR